MHRNRFWRLWAWLDERTLFLTNCTAGGQTQQNNEEYRSYFECSHKISVCVHFGLDFMRKAYFCIMNVEKYFLLRTFQNNVLEQKQWKRDTFDWIKCFLQLFWYDLHSNRFWRFWAWLDEITLFLTNCTARGQTQQNNKEYRSPFECSYKISVCVHFGLDFMRKPYFCIMNV